MDTSSQKKVKTTYTANEVLTSLQITTLELEAFEQEGVIDFLEKEEKSLDAENYQRLETGINLQREFGVNLPGIDIILNMREKMSSMQSELNSFLGGVRESLNKTLEADLLEIQKLRKK